MENIKAIDFVTFSNNKYWMDKTKNKCCEAVERIFGQYEFYKEICLNYNSVYIGENRIEVSLDYEVIDWHSFLEYKEEVQKSHRIIVDAWPTQSKVISIGYTRKTLEKKLAVIAEAAEGFRNLTIKHRALFINQPVVAKLWLKYLEDLFVLQGIVN